MKPDLFVAILRRSLWVAKMSGIGAVIVIALTIYRALRF